jgi:type II secretory pathway component PulF
MRRRWLEWVNVALWGAVGGSGVYLIPRLEEPFASFGAELPWSTRVLMGSRPVFFLMCAGAVVGGLWLLARREARVERRWLLWVGAGAAVVTAVLGVMAAFAPMFIGEIVE